MLNPEEFQRLLRVFGGPLAQCEVKPLSENLLLAPHDVKVCHFIHIHGRPLWVESELDLRSIRNAQDVCAFAGKLLQAFEEAAEKPEMRVH